MSTAIVTGLAVFGALSLVSSLLVAGGMLYVCWHDERREAQERAEAVEQLLAESLQEHQR